MELRLDSFKVLWLPISRGLNTVVRTVGKAYGLCRPTIKPGKIFRTFETNLSLVFQPKNSFRLKYYDQISNRLESGVRMQMRRGKNLDKLHKILLNYKPPL